MADSSDAENQQQLIPSSEILHQDLIPHSPNTNTGIPNTTSGITNTGSGRGRGRGRGKKSLVWEHFTVLNCSDNTKRACCNLCKQTFAYSDGSKVAGTSHLKRHITLASCPVLKSGDYKPGIHFPVLGTPNPDSSESYRPAKRKYRVSGFSSASFDHELSVSNLAKMVILNDYPLHLVEQQGFLNFVESLQPRFSVNDSNAMEQEVLGVYYKEKQHLMQMFANVPGRVSLTIGLWTTSQTLGYVELYGQFIDSDWRLNRRMLNFLMVAAPHSENALSEAIEVSLNDWGLKSKLFTITLDNNCSSHDIYSANLRDHLNNKDTLMLKGQLFVVRCYAHVLNAVAQDVIASIHGIIYNIRESVKFIKASPSREEKFAEIALELQIPSAKTLSLDTTTQWNTTYNMLVAALEYQQAFTLLETCDDNYNEAPSSEDWKKVEVAIHVLKLLYESANAITTNHENTANIFYHEAWKIQLELKNAVNSDDLVISSMAKEMFDKFDRYWKDCSLILAIAVVMDPRFKMKLVSFSFEKIYGVDGCKKYVKMVDDAIHDLYNEYVDKVQPLPLTPVMQDSVQQETVQGNMQESVQEPELLTETVQEPEPVQTETMQESVHETIQETEPVQETETIEEQLVLENNNADNGDENNESNVVNNEGGVYNNESNVVDEDYNNNENNAGDGDENNEVNEGDYNEEDNVVTGGYKQENNVANDGCENMEIEGEVNIQEPVPIEENIHETVAMEAEIEANNNVMIQTEDNNNNDTNTNTNIDNNNNESEIKSEIQPAAPISSTGDGLLDFEIYLSEIAVNQPTKPELDLYLEEILVPRTQEFDILNWWKQNTFKYPTLAKMVRDVLAVPMAMTGTGASVFGTGGGNRVLDEYRSSLRPETLEAIFCAKDWLQYVPMSVQEAPHTPGSSAQGVKMEY